MKRNFLKKMSVVLALSVAACSITACGGSSSGSSDTKTETSAEKEAQDTLTVVVDSDLGNMNMFGSGTAHSYMATQVYESLYTFGYNMEETPVLAESWEQVDDTHYTFHLRENMQDSAGNAITASDVLFSMNLYTEDANYSQYVAHIDFEKTTATDDRTLDVYFLDTNAFAFSQLAGVAVVSQASWEASEDQMVTKPVGSGPYMLKEYVSGSYFTLELNPNYTGTAVPTFKEIKFNIVSEPSQRTTQLETGAADLVMNLQSSDVKYINDKDEYTVEQKIATQTMTLFLNMSENSLLASKELRQAICYSIDNDSMNVAAYGGYCAPSTTFFSTSMSDYTDDMASEIYSTCDQNKVAELVAASGVNGGELHIATDGTTQENTIAEIIQSNLVPLGFDVKIDNYDSATIWSVAADPTQWDLLLTIASAPSGNGLDEMTAFIAGLNFSQWSGDSFEECVSCLLEASNTVDEELRLDLTKKALAILVDEAPAYGIVQIAQSYAYRSDLNFEVWNQASLNAADLKIS